MKPKTPFQKMRDNRAKLETAIHRQGVRVSLQWPEEAKEIMRRSQHPLMFNMIQSGQHQGTIVQGGGGGDPSQINQATYGAYACGGGSA